MGAAVTGEVKIMEHNKTLSVVIGSYNRLRFLKRTIESLRKELHASTLSYEIIVVDGGSTDRSMQWLVRQKDIITLVQHNRGEWRGRTIERRSWGYFMNLGFKCAQGKFVCMLSDDCLVVPGAILNGVRLFEERLRAGEQIGAVAFYWRNWPEQKRYRVGLTLGGKMFVNHGLYLRKALDAVGYIDEETYRFYHADGDLCLKMLQKGYTCVDAPGSFIEHYYHAAKEVRKSNLTTQGDDFAAYLAKWQGIYYDPASGKNGGWIECDFADGSRTAHRFKGAAPVNCYVRLNLLKLLGPLLDKLRGAR